MARDYMLRVRLSTEERRVLEQAAKKKDLSVSEFVRYMSVEMARAIAENRGVEETYYAVLMGVGRIAPEVVLYSATASPSPSPSPGPFEEDEEWE